jgi:hypothetical protein
MLIHDFFKIPIGIALGVVLGLLVLAIAVSPVLSVSVMMATPGIMGGFSPKAFL